MSKVTKDQYIKDLEHDRNKLADMVIELKAQLESLVKRVPSKYLVDEIGESQPSLFDGNQTDLFEDK